MAIADSMVKLMDGQILVESEEGKGTEFSVYLSLPVAEQTVEKENEVFPDEEENPERARVLEGFTLKGIRMKVECCFPGIREEEYFRVCDLTQKYRFGGLELEAKELRVLWKFRERLQHCLYRKQRFYGKLKLRYLYVL